MGWTDWFYRGIPEVGDYIRCEGFIMPEGQPFVHEGLVLKIKDFMVDMAPPLDDSAVAYRWKKRIIGQADDAEQEKELELV